MHKAKRRGESNMQSQELCDYCFTPIQVGQICPECGRLPNSYQTDKDLLQPGTILKGDYVIGSTLGRGGFGVTYLAYSYKMQKRVAIKEYFPNGIAIRGLGDKNISIVSDEKRDIFNRGAKRFFTEAKTLSAFNNSRNIVNVYEFFYENDTAYYSMEYLEGIDLKGYAAKSGGVISVGEAANIMKQACSAFKDIHSAGVLHRDISPDNIFICKDGTVKLIDFGAAKQFIGENSQNMSVIIKQGFAPMEQYQTNGKQGTWTDIYALGASIYYALTGHVPNDALTRMQNPQIDFPDELNIPKGMQAVINKCMKVKIDERYQFARDVLNALEKLNIQEKLPDKGYKQIGGEKVKPYPQQPQYSQSQYSQQQPYPPYPQPEPPKDKLKTVRIIILVFGILFIIAMLITLFIELMRSDSDRGMLPGGYETAVANIIEDTIGDIPDITLL